MTILFLAVPPFSPNDLEVTGRVTVTIVLLITLHTVHWAGLRIEKRSTLLHSLEPSGNDGSVPAAFLLQSMGILSSVVVVSKKYGQVLIEIRLGIYIYTK